MIPETWRGIRKQSLCEEAEMMIGKTEDWLSLKTTRLVAMVIDFEVVSVFVNRQTAR